MIYNFIQTNSNSSSENSGSSNNIVINVKNPTINENLPVGTIWENTVNGKVFMCKDNTPNKNIWVGYKPTLKIAPTTAGTLDVFEDGSCVALYQFDNNANDTGGVYNGIEKGDISYKAGKYNKAIYLNGNNAYVDLGNQMDDAYYSFSFWADWSNTSRKWERIFDFGEHQGSNWQCLICRRDDTNILCYKNGGNNIYSDDGCIINNELHFYAVVQNEGTVYFYRDGKLFSETTTSERPKTHSRSYCYIGKSNWSGDKIYKGIIDQLRIFNRPLTSDEVSQLYNE